MPTRAEEANGLDAETLQVETAGPDDEDIKDDSKSSPHFISALEAYAKSLLSKKVTSENSKYARDNVAQGDETNHAEMDSHEKHNDEMESLVSAIKKEYDLPAHYTVSKVFSMICCSLLALKDSITNYLGNSEVEKLNFEAMFYCTPVPMAVTNPNGSFITCNDLWSRVCKINMSEIKGYSIQSLAHPKAVVQVYEALQRFSERSIIRWNGILLCIDSSKNEYSIDLEMLAVSTREDNGSLNSIHQNVVREPKENANYSQIDELHLNDFHILCSARIILPQVSYMQSLVEVES